MEPMCCKNIHLTNDTLIWQNYWAIFLSFSASYVNFQMCYDKKSYICKNSNSDCKRFCSPLYLYDCCHLTTLITVKLCTIMYYYVNNPPMEAIPYRFFAQSFELFSAQQIWNSRSISAGCQTFNLCRVLPPSQNKTNLPSQTKPLPAKRSVDLVDIILNFSIHASDACKELLKVVSQ